jgi:hypothetical protein
MLKGRMARHLNEEINELAAGYARAGFHPWPCTPLSYDQPMAEWTIAEMQFMASKCSSVTAGQVTIRIN